jgi:hypothetical protein
VTQNDFSIALVVAASVCMFFRVRSLNIVSVNDCASSGIDSRAIHLAPLDGAGRWSLWQVLAQASRLQIFQGKTAP